MTMLDMVRWPHGKVGGDLPGERVKAAPVTFPLLSDQLLSLQHDYRDLSSHTVTGAARKLGSYCDVW